MKKIICIISVSFLSAISIPFVNCSQSPTQSNLDTIVVRDTIVIKDTQYISGNEHFVFTWQNNDTHFVKDTTMLIGGSSVQYKIFNVLSWQAPAVDSNWIGILSGKSSDTLDPSNITPIQYYYNYGFVGQLIVGQRSGDLFYYYCITKYGLLLYRCVNDTNDLKDDTIKYLLELNKNRSSVPLSKLFTVIPE